ncbi:unnamed protein product [Plutella xylostella]|uniref:(diamondback moth) hypothetical protein n=1 Tax=Plutella xylostella TaxID=51655 RepID=A0A8S4G3D3_PLUXY|nr:unnamed protein product [Plutella xylostella]
MQPININRYIPTNTAVTEQLIGFADASSTTGYGCCMYHRVVDKTANPADLISRGISPQELPNSALWWEGPEFLQSEYKFESKDLDLPVSLPEMKKSKTTPLPPKVAQSLCSEAANGILASSASHTMQTIPENRH